MGALPFVLEPVERIWKLFLLSGMVLGVGQAVAGCINEVLFVNLSWIFFWLPAHLLLMWCGGWCPELPLAGKQREALLASVNFVSSPCVCI